MGDFFMPKINNQGVYYARILRRNNMNNEVLNIVKSLLTKESVRDILGGFVASLMFAVMGISICIIGG